VWDENGVQYLDMYGGHAVICIGHTHPHWVHRIEDQLHKIAFYSNSVRIPIQQELADKLEAVSGKKGYNYFFAIAEQRQMRTRLSSHLFTMEKESSCVQKKLSWKNFSRRCCN
jgi:acetylornithine/succinyldiaminopimelate/putrescine aminotransferase